MEDEPGAGDLNCPTHNEIEGLISMTVCCRAPVFTEEYMPPIGREEALKRAGQNRCVPGVSPSKRVINIFAFALPAPFMAG